MLDQMCENVAKESGLRGQHKDLKNKFEKAVQDAFASSGSVTDSMTKVFASYQKENLNHLEAEEKVMMPSIMLLMMSGSPMKKLMAEEILPLIAEDDREFFINLANEILQKNEGGMPRVRVFDHALGGIATPKTMGTVE